MKKSKLLIPLTAITTATVVVAPMTACGGTVDPTPEVVKVEEVKFNQEYSYVETNTARDFSKEVKVLPETATNKSLTWSITEKYSEIGTTVATVDANTGVVTGKSVGVVKLTCKSNDGSAKTTEQTLVIGEYVQLQSISLEPTTKTITPNSELQINTTYSPANATTAKYSEYGSVEWTSSDESVATVDATGKVSAVSVGKATITCTPRDYDPLEQDFVLKPELKQTCEITVDYDEGEEIVVTPSIINFHVGDTRIVKARIKPSTAKQDAVYEGTYPETQDIFSYDETTGEVKGLKEGTAYIVFTSETCKESFNACKVNVLPEIKEVQSIEFASTSKTMTEGDSWTTVAKTDVIITPEDATVQEYTLESSNPDVAYIDPSDQKTVIAKKEGTAEITVHSNDQEHSSTTPCTITVEKKTVAVTGVKLTPTTATIKQGQQITLKHEVQPSDATNKNVTWSSSNEDIVSVDQKGVITGVAEEGNATITVTTEDGGFEATCAVTVEPEFIYITDVTLSSTSLTLKGIEEKTVTATISPGDASLPYLYWWTDDETIATVEVSSDTKSATIKSQNIGSTTIHVMTLDGSLIYKTINVDVTYDDATSIKVFGSSQMYVGRTNAFVADVMPVTACPVVKWSSSAPSIVSIDQNGKAKALKEGTAYITCETTVGKSLKSDPYKVVAEIEPIPVTKLELNPSSISIRLNDTANLPTVTYTPDTTTDKTVHWESGDTNIVTIDEETKKITAIGEGETDITCTSVWGPKATCHVTVDKPLPTDIIVWGSPKQLNIRQKSKIYCSIIPAKARQDVEFVSTTPSIISVDNEGNLVGLSEGTGQIKITAVDNPKLSKVLTIPVTGYTSFADDTWDNVIKYAELGIDELHKHYSLDCEKNTEFPNTLIGYKRTLHMYNSDYQLRVIGENHDDLYDGSGKAALTFDSIHFVEAADGNYMEAKVESDETKFDYLNSDLRKCMSGKGNGKVCWYGSGQEIITTETKSIMEMIDESEHNLASHIKTVKKQVITNSEFKKTDFGETIFPLSLREMNYDSDKSGHEGEPYAYWLKFTTFEDRKKWYPHHGGEEYWTISAISKSEYHGWFGIANSGALLSTYADSTNAVSFAFCI